MAADPVVSPADTLWRIMELTKAHQPERFDDVAREIHDLAAALLAVGERDKAEIEALTAAVEGLLDVGTRSRIGDPSLDPEEWFAIRDYAQKVLKDAGGAALRESRERDRQQIARALALLEEVPYEDDEAEDAIQAVRAVLAGEEDART